MSEIVADWESHVIGERELVSWDRPDGQTYHNVPIVYLREVTQAEYLATKPHCPPSRIVGARFWEVSVD
jgi:hypothetical protein